MKIDYTVVLNGYNNHGYSRDWLKGYIQCLYVNQLITSEEEIELFNYVEQYK